MDEKIYDKERGRSKMALMGKTVGDGEDVEKGRQWIPVWRLLQLMGEEMWGMGCGG